MERLMERSYLLKSISCFSLFGISSLAKISFIIGSQAAFFSLAPITAPVIGIFGGLSTLCVVGFLKALFSVFLGGAIIIPGLYFLTHIAAAFYFNSSSKLRLFVPLLAMLIFWLHANGSFYYSLLWLIPVLGIIFGKNIFFRALGATFSAHAVGSLIWLFTVPMTSLTWFAIIPVALIERSLFAIGISLVYYVFHKLAQVKIQALKA
ncbi:hypothetical protein A3F66_00360 [candidate division TM6 bacterium RIFCSPHIGHO2_12_FULL_32_22]|nr:MAG: hypothetical protein A3F66_00360 [candidate division TM6 bacterium RIFCSPHIGHO2_12_FULL_32_22]